MNNNTRQTQLNRCARAYPLLVLMHIGPDDGQDGDSWMNDVESRGDVSIIAKAGPTNLGSIGSAAGRWEIYLVSRVSKSRLSPCRLPSPTPFHPVTVMAAWNGLGLILI